MQTLTTQQVHSLNHKHGAGLEEGKGKMYVQSFLINSQQNQAGDPHPFRVDNQLLPKLARTAIGMPWLPYPKSDGNHQRPIGAAAFTADGIKQHQQQFAGGEIVAQYTNESTGNVNVIIDVFPEYQEAVRSKKIPAFVSPMIFPHDMTPEGLVKEGEILHLQSVHHPGYAPEVAKINSVCEGNGLKQCMTQMKALAASGKLAPFQSKVKNYIAKNVSPADKTQMGKVKIGGETNWYDANKNEFQFSPEYKHNFPNPEKLPIVVQHEIGHMHWHHTLTPAQRKAFAKNVPKDLEISPYAIQHKRMLFKAVIAFRKDKSSKNRKAVKRAYGEYIREVFAILHSMRQEPDYVQRLKTDGLKQGMSAYMGALGAAGPSDADIQKFDKKIARESNNMSTDSFGGGKRGYGNVIYDAQMGTVLERHKAHPKRTTKLHPSTKSVERDWYEVENAQTPAELTKARKTLKNIFANNPGLEKMYKARQNAFKKLNRQQRAGVKNAPVFWRGFRMDELKDMVKTGKFNSSHPDESQHKSISMSKEVGESFAYDVLAQLRGDKLRKGKSVKPIIYGQPPNKNGDIEWQNKFITQREALLKHGTNIFDKNGRPKIRELKFSVENDRAGKRMQKKYQGVAGKVTYVVGNIPQFRGFGAAGSFDDDVAKFDKKMNRQTQSYNKHDKTGLNVNKIMPLSFEDVVVDNYPNDKRRTKLSPSTEDVKNQLGELARYEYLKDGKKTKALLSKIFKNNPGLKKVYDTRARAVSKLNRHQSQGFKNAPVFWRGTGTKELNDMLKRKHTRKVMKRRNHVNTGDLGSLTLDKKVAEEFMDHDLYDDKRALLQYDANILRKKGAVRPILHGQSPLTNIKNAGWYGRSFEQREVTLDNKVPLLDKNNKPQIINKIHFKVKSKVIGERMKKKYGGLAKNISYEITPTESATKNKMGRSDKWDKEERGDMRDGDPDEFDYENYDFKSDPTSKGKRQWHHNPHMKEEYEDQIEDLREDDLLITEHKKGKFKLPTRLQPALAGDPMRIKKAKRQMQAKRELMRKKLNRKTRVANRMGKPKKKPKFTMTPTGGGKDIPIEDDAFEALVKRERVRPKKKMTKYEKSMDLKRMNKELHLSRNPQERKSTFFPKHPDYIKNTEDYISGKNALTDTPEHRNLLRRMKRERNTLFRKTKVKNRLGEEGQSDRAAERYKAEQSEDKILTKKNTSAKYRRQVKDDRSAYARKNPKYAALRPELRKHMSLKTRRANKMGKFNVRSNPKNSPDARKERKLNRKSPFEYNKKEQKFSASQSGKRRKLMIKDFTPEQKADYFRKLSDIDRTLMMDYSTQINNGTYGNTF